MRPEFPVANELPAESESVAEAAPAAAVRPRRRGRTTLLIAAAAVLGALAGTVTGYAVQYDREPTPLPPLAQPGLEYPKPRPAEAGTTARSVNANRWHKTEDDLRELLVPAPKGATNKLRANDSADVFAGNFEYPASMLRKYLGADLRRVSRAEWQEGDHRFVTVRLVQFRDYAAAEDYQEDQSAYMGDEEHADNPGEPVPGVPEDNGRAWVYSKADTKPGYLPYRSARALVRRGNVVIDIRLGDNRGKIAERDLISLAKRQLERL
ncbi:hypothetical protein ACIQUQ_30770 [Streptomyces sp. NPDC101118]|uniref:hypothetical protein n=1 Tax=Streptomyces sp. NPDC101118 TaxID=3366109 RepID=UPI0037F3F811